MLKTAESVSPRHPDKVCDQISDAILDACLREDPESRVAIEVMGGHNLVVVMGELTTNSNIDIPAIVERIAGPGHEVKLNIISQSREIAQGVDNGGAGDQGIMVGYACADNKMMIPQEMYLAKDICRFIYNHYPTDGKTQVTLSEGHDIKTIIASFCGVPGIKLRELIIEWWKQYANNSEASVNFEILANPAGDWNQGGFAADTGLTGRKLAVDNYGPQIPIGGGAFSGKDSTKVDRSGAYMARRVAVDLLRENGFKEVMVKIAYAIGQSDPVMATFQALAYDKSGNQEAIRVEGEVDREKYDLSPSSLINYLGLKKPQFEETARWGAFGHGFEWDK